MYYTVVDKSINIRSSDILYLLNIPLEIKVGDNNSTIQAIMSEAAHILSNMPSLSSSVNVFESDKKEWQMIAIPKILQHEQTNGTSVN